MFYSFSFRILFSAIVFIFLGFLIFRNEAFAQTCTTPGTPSNVLITYPACTGPTCSGTQATCTWGAATSAASYSVQITEVDSGSVITTQSLPSSTLTYTFGVTSGKTYKCSVTAVNSCGTAGAAGTFSLLCQTDVLPNPTAAPTAIPTAVPIVNNPPPIQEVPVTGNNYALVLFGVASTVIMFFGIVLLRL